MTIYIGQISTSGMDKRIYHTDPDCRYLKRASSVTEWSDDNKPARARLCKACEANE